MWGLSRFVQLKYPDFLEEHLSHKDLKNIAKAEDIEIVYEDLDNMNSLYLVTSKGKKIIFLNSSLGKAGHLSEAGQWYQLGVELGHYFLHQAALIDEEQLEKYYEAIDQGNAKVKEKYEKVWDALNIEAELFAVMTFLPDTHVEHLMTKCKDDQAVLEECYEFTIKKLTPLLKKSLSDARCKKIKERLERRLDFHRIRPVLWPN